MLASSCSPPPFCLLTTVSISTKTQTLTSTPTQIQTRIRSITESDPLRYCRCGRRHLLGSSLLLPILPSNSQAVAASDTPTCAIDKFHPPRADWYEEFYAQSIDKGMTSYEAEIAGYKEELFGRLTVSGKSKNIVELGVGTGANFKYYTGAADLNVIGVDPNKKMEKYARAAAVAAGLPPTSFTFIRGVGEALPIGDNSMDAVIGTLIMCSVKDVDIALKEVRRVLKPGGVYIFIEHVAASDGSLLRLMQNFLDPLQQFVADGCHLTRETGKQISEVGFSNVIRLLCVA